MSLRRHPKPKVSLIAARSRNGVIGVDGDLPWRISADLKHFKRLTVGKPIVMGRKTWDSLGKALPGRHNIVLTREPDFSADGATVVHTLADALDAAGLTGEIMVIGGGEIYRLTLPIATRLYMTEVDLDIDGDAYFPDFDEAQWAAEVTESAARDGETPAYKFVTYDRAT